MRGRTDQVLLKAGRLGRYQEEVLVEIRVWRDHSGNVNESRRAATREGRGQATSTQHVAADEERYEGSSAARQTSSVKSFSSFYNCGAEICDLNRASEDRQGQAGRDRQEYPVSSLNHDGATFLSLCDDGGDWTDAALVKVLGYLIHRCPPPTAASYRRQMLICVQGSTFTTGQSMKVTERLHCCQVLISGTSEPICVVLARCHMHTCTWSCQGGPTCCDSLSSTVSPPF